LNEALAERYDAGMQSCYSRGDHRTLPVVCYAAGMTGCLNATGIRIFDYPVFAKTLWDRVCERAAPLAAEAGVSIEPVGKPNISKKDIIARVPEKRGDHPGLVHVLSTMEACDAYRPWHDKQTDPAVGWTGSLAASTNWRAARTEAWLAFVVLTTERKAA
jgi:hypothetical protein